MLPKFVVGPCVPFEEWKLLEVTECHGSPSGDRIRGGLIAVCVTKRSTMQGFSERSESHPGTLRWGDLTVEKSGWAGA